MALVRGDTIFVDDSSLTNRWTLSSCSSIDDSIYLMSGALVDPYRYPSLQQNDDLWRCEGCGAVHRVKDTLECTKCGLFITEESRFVLR